MHKFFSLCDKSRYQADLDLVLNTSRREFLITSVALSCGAALGLVPEVGVTAARSTLDVRLENEVENYIKKARRYGSIQPDESTAWSIYDFTMRKKLVSINENIPFQSASMIKPFVALAFFYKVAEDHRSYRYDRRTQAVMEAMIRRSSNRATNYLIDLIGRKPKDVERILKRHAPDVFQQTSIVEKIPSNGRTYRNKASARDYSRFLYAVWHNLFPYSDELKKLMNLPNRDRINYGAEQVPSVTKVYDKTGTTARLCGNMGILEARGRDGRSYPYTFIGIIQKASPASNYSVWSHSRGDIIRGVSNIVYTKLKRVYNLV